MVGAEHPYGVLLADALVAFVPPDLTARWQRAHAECASIIDGYRARRLNYLVSLMPGDGAPLALPIPPPGIKELWEASRVRVEALREQLCAGGVEAHWTDDPLGAWQPLPRHVWLGDISCRVQLDGSCEIVWPPPRPKRRRHVRFQLAVRDDCACLAESEPVPDMSLEEHMQRCIADLRALADASPDRRTHNQDQVREFLRARWPQALDKHIREIRRQALDRVRHKAWLRGGPVAD